MTLEEAIKYYEEVAEEQEKVAREYHECEVRKCEIIPFAEMDYTRENKCMETAEEYRQLAEWLKELKKYRKKQIPQKPEYIADGYSDGELVYDMAKCPNCGNDDYEYDYDYGNWGKPFCPECGQALDWSEEE